MRSRKKGLSKKSQNGADSCLHYCIQWIWKFSKPDVNLGLLYWSSALEEKLIWKERTQDGIPIKYIFLLLWMYFISVTRELCNLGKSTEKVKLYKTKKKLSTHTRKGSEIINIVLGPIPAPVISWADIMLHCNGGGNQAKKDLCLFLFSQMGLSINPMDLYDN